MSGPYREAGDASENSPGDWTRISENAETFRSDPSGKRWSGPGGSGCVDKNGDPPRAGADLLRDAAFYSLVMDDAQLREAAAAELVQQAGQAQLDFSDSDRWCRGVYDKGISFGIAALLTKLALAYDYLGEEAFSPEEHDRLRAWFRHAAGWLLADVEDKLDENFSDRRSGDYRLSRSRASDPGWGRVGYLGSQPTGAIARYYNNRRATAMFFVALIGWQQEDEKLIESSRRFVEEWLTYGVYPDGWTGEFERWREDLPDLGWAYSTYNVALGSMTADLFARHGDDALFEFVTSDGVHGTEGGPKSLHGLLRAHAGYLDGTYERYGTNEKRHEGEDDYLIDGTHEPSDWYSVHDISAVVANRYYRDPYLRDVYMRTAPGVPPYPEEPATQGGNNPWSGVWGIYPGALFMFGQMEDVDASG